MVLTEKSTPMVEMNCKVGTSGGVEGVCQGMREACGGTVAVVGDHGGHCDHGGGLRSPARTLPSYSSSVYRFTILDFPTAESPMSSTCVEHWGRHRAGNVQSDEEGRAVGAGQGERGGRSASTGGLEAGVMRRMGEGGGFKVTTGRRSRKGPMHPSLHRRCAVRPESGGALGTSVTPRWRRRGLEDDDDRSRH